MESKMKAWWSALRLIRWIGTGLFVALMVMGGFTVLLVVVAGMWAWMDFIYSLLL